MLKTKSNINAPGSPRMTDSVGGFPRIQDRARGVSSKHTARDVLEVVFVTEQIRTSRKKAVCLLGKVGEFPTSDFCRSLRVPMYLCDGFGESDPKNSRFAV